MSTVQRAFAQKLSKQHAADVRRNIAVYQPPKSDGISGCSSSVSLCDLVEPLDYEDFLAQNNLLLERDPLRHILDFPSNDLEVGTVARKIRTVMHVVPEERLSELPIHIRSCVQCYTRDWSVVTLNYRHLSSSSWCRGAPWPQTGRHCGATRHEFQVDWDESVRDDTSYRSDSLPPSRHSISSLSSCTDTDSVAGDVPVPPRGSWASLDLRSSVSDPLLPGLLDRMNPDAIDEMNEDKRMEDREDCLFWLFPEPEMDEPVERRSLPEPPAEHLGHRILVKCLQLKLDLEVEPIFASMALYDAKERKKLSENFYFDMNSESLKRMLTSHVPYCDVSTLSRGAVFDITYPTADLFIVVRLEKVLQGDISECAEPYLKDDKNREKVRANAAASCERLGKYRMPFAWTAIYLMNVISGSNSLERADSDRDSLGMASTSNSLDRKSSTSSFDSLRKRASDMGGTLGRRGSLERRGTDKRRSWPLDECTNTLDSFRPVTLTVSSFFKQESDKLRDEDLYKFLLDLKRPCSALKKLKCIPGSLKLDISPCPEDLKCTLTPDLCKLAPFPDDNTRPVKEILEFPLHPIYVPHFSYRNLLYVCPREINFSARAGSARNITVRVQLMEGESQTDALNAIFAKSSCPEFTTEAFTAVSYHNKTPVFYDEIKARLPGALGAQHHLLFTFYHISCQRKPQETSNAVETPVGYTWLPIYRDGRLITGEFCLPVMAELPPPNYSYIPPDVLLPGTRWIDGHRPLFSVLVDAVTSVHFQDSYIDKFFSFCDMVDDGGKIPPRIGEENMEREFKKSILELAEAKPEPLVRGLVPILDKLIQLLVQPPRLSGNILCLGSTLFHAIAAIVNNIASLQEFSLEQHGRQSLLSSYVSYHCLMPHPLAQSSVPVTSPYTAYSDTDIHGNLDLDGKGHDRSSHMRSGVIDPPYIVNSNIKIVHEEIALQWVVSSGKPRDLAMANSWFIFELMVKSMGDHLYHTDTLKSPRKTRFSHQYTDDVTNLSNLVTSEIISRHSTDTKLSQSLNASLAFFCFDLLSIMDRGFVFGLIRSYFKQITAKIGALPDAAVLIEYKLDFLRIVCSHEHFVALNLPFGTPYTNPRSNPPSPTPSMTSVNSQNSFVSTLVSGDRSCYSELCPEFKSQHFLVGLLLTELSSVLDIQNPGLHAKAVHCVRNLLACHDSDARYSEHNARARVAALYLPLMAIVMDCLPQLYQHYETRDRLQSMGLDNNQTHSDQSGNGNPNSSVSSGHQSFSSSMTGMALTGINQNVAMAIAGGRLPEKEQYGTLSQSHSRKVTLSAESTNHLLCCFLWVLKSLNKSAISQWGATLSPRRIQQLLKVLNMCIACFEYKGKKELNRCAQQSFRKAPTDIKSRLEDVILGQGSARNEMIQRRKERNPPPSPAGSGSSNLRWRREHMYNRPSSVSGNHGEAVRSFPNDLGLLQNCASEASFIVLDTLEHIVQVAVSSDSHHTILSMVLKVLLHALSCNQSTAVLQSMFATQRSLVFKFHSILFDEDNEQCSDLCLLLLKHCSSHLASVRSHAAASLYLLMRQTFEIGNNFARVKMQVTMSLSSLVGTSSSFSEGSLRRALKTILVYSETDEDLLHTTFPEQVKDLLFNLHMILSDTVKMKEYQEDPEMLLDLMYRIAKGYRNSPDLRLTWLANMAQKHMERNNHTEAGMCLVHSAALVAEYLQMLEPLQHLPIGAAALQGVTPNALQESAVSDDVLSPGDEAGCLGRDFTEAGLLGLLEHAASSFHTAGMFETMSDVYSVLIPIAKANRDHKKLANIHSKLHEAYSRIEQLHGKRVFGTYFRVAFFGEKFGDLDGQEFVYKEPTLTKLPEIFSRLENFYTDRFGPDSVQIIKDSNTVDPSTLHPDKAYIQITYVEPYFEPYELRHRVTHFERNFNIKRFIFATPFTPAGRAHGELHEQCKRKTVLTTANHFPYVKTRIQVVHRKQIVLSPIEVAIEDIQKKTTELAAAIVQEPPDPKILQMVLQGCIGTTVNQGPMEMALVFLSCLSDGTKIPTKCQNKLRLCFKDFSKKCHDALKKNKNLIGADQRDYQRELERNYQRFIERLAPLVTITPAQAAALASSGGFVKSTPLRW